MNHQTQDNAATLQDPETGSPGAVDTQEYYEREAAEHVRGEPEDPWRFGHTIKALPATFDLLLDVGCGEGRWLAYLQRRRPGRTYAGVEVSPSRVEEARTVNKGLDIKVGGLPNLPYDDRSFDVVTCLEVIEHLPDWKGAVTELIRIARRRVLITVPYRERIRQHLCIHCHKTTPAYGHLHSFSEESFDYLRKDHSVSFRRIPRRGGTWPARIYLTLMPQYAWLAVMIDVQRRIAGATGGLPASV